MTEKHHKIGDLKVWWITQVPMKSFIVDVATVEEGVKIMDVLADYDQFQFENNVKPDYANVGGLQVFIAVDGEQPRWMDWWDEETGEEDPKIWLKEKQKKSC